MKTLAATLCLFCSAAFGQPLMHDMSLRDAALRLCSFGTKEGMLTTYEMSEFGAPELRDRTPMQTPHRALQIVFPQAPQHLRELLVPDCDTFWR